MPHLNILIRYIQVFLFVLIYITIGFMFKLDANKYLLLGIPLALIFQIFIRKQPIQTLWVRDYHKFQLSKCAALIALALMAYPIKKIIGMVLIKDVNPTILCYYFVALIGAVGAAFSISWLTKATIRPFLLCLATAGSVGLFIILFTGTLRSILLSHPLHFQWTTFLNSLLMYIPICYVLEEVVFRGLLDSHLYQPGEPKGIWSAIFVSALWGLWHLPIAPGDVTKHYLFTICLLLGVHTSVGVPLSIFWRRSGNLIVPAFTHSLIDAVRNALLK